MLLLLCLALLCLLPSTLTCLIAALLPISVLISTILNQSENPQPNILYSLQYILTFVGVMAPLIAGVGVAALLSNYIPEIKPHRRALFPAGLLLGFIIFERVFEFSSASMLDLSVFLGNKSPSNFEILLSLTTLLARLSFCVGVTTLVIISLLLTVELPFAWLLKVQRRSLSVRTLRPILILALVSVSFNFICEFVRHELTPVSKLIIPDTAQREGL